MPHIVRHSAAGRALIHGVTGNFRRGAVIMLSAVAAGLLAASASAQSAPPGNPLGIPVTNGAVASGGLATTPDGASGNAFGGTLGGSFFNPDTTPDASLTAITVQGQISVVFQSGGKLGMAHNSFENSALGPNATQEAVVQLLQQAATEGLGKAAEHGAQTGRADVIATVYRFAGDAKTQTIAAWQPLGTFINSTEMTLDPAGKAAFHAHIQFIPDDPTK